MSATPSPYFFISYSREDTSIQQRIIRGLRAQGFNIWVDTENLIPGSPAWEREVERAIRGAAAMIVLLSPSSNNSEWVRREISFAEGNKKHIFPVMIRGDEDDSIPLRLSAHQRVDLRRRFDDGIGHLSNTLRNFLGTTLVPTRKKQSTVQFDFQKMARPALFGVIGLAVIGCLFFAGRFALNLISNVSTPPVDTDTTPTEDVTPNSDDAPTGKIIFTCQVQGDEICIINPDGSGWKRLTNIPQAAFNASLSPDGEQAVYVISDGNNSEVHELSVNSGNTSRLTDLGQSVGSPEISPDNQFILFHYRSGNSNLELWLMNRDGNDPHQLLREAGRDVHDGTWSPDGTQILFALGRGENNNLYVIDFNGRDPRLLNDSIDTRGRSDWGVNDLIALDMGGSFAHSVYTMDTNGRALQALTLASINAQGASISPDGNWITFTAYTNVADKDLNSCEIFIMRVDGSDVRQLTNNGYCDYQPRWGN